MSLKADIKKRLEKVFSKSFFPKLVSKSLHFGEILRNTPLPLVAIFCLFLVVPLWSVTFLGWPWNFLFKKGITLSTLLLFSYWIFPLLLCVFSLRRHFAFVPLFFIECLLLLLHTLLDLQTKPTELQIVRFILIAGMVVFCVIFLRKDSLYPLLAGKRRGWRKTPRLELDLPVEVGDQANKRIQMNLKDCSITGLSIAGYQPEVMALFEAKKHLSRFTLSLWEKDNQWELPVELVRWHDENGIRYLGFRVLDPTLMSQFIDSLEMSHKGLHLKSRFDKYWVRKGFQNAVLALWMVSTSGVFIIPSCKEESNDSLQVLKSVSLAEDTSTGILLETTDSDGNPLTYQISEIPKHGLLQGVPPSLTYTPLPNFSGEDSFMVVVTDSSSNSTNRLVTISVNPVNDIPTASNLTVTLTEDFSYSGKLIASDVDGSSLTYSIVKNGAKGVSIIDASTGAFTYKPNLDATGADSFTFNVTDESLSSNVATVSLTIYTLNDAPLARSGTLNVTEDTAAAGTLLSTDVDLDSTTLSIVTNGQKGTVIITDPSTGAFTYTPIVNANGGDSFTFKARDGSLDSNVQTISVTINPVNDSPVAQNGILTLDEDTSVSGKLNASDVDGDTLIYSITSPPTKGKIKELIVATGDYRYESNANVNGEDSFTFEVYDGKAKSNTSTITVNIGSVNDAPVVSNQAIVIDEDATFSGTFLGTDIENDPLTYSIVDNGTLGNLAITNSKSGAFTYTPNPNKYGTDSFKFRTRDGTLNSNDGIVNVTINAKLDDEKKIVTPGRAVSIFGNTALVGDPNYSNFIDQSIGQAGFYEKNNDGNWNLVSSNLASERNRGDGFGNAVSISGNIAIIGDQYGGYYDYGLAFILEKQGSQWVETTKLTNSFQSLFGCAVSISGTTAIVGSKLDSSSGAAFIFQKNTSGQWPLITKLVPSDIKQYDQFGHSVSISGNIAIVSSGGSTVYVFEKNGLGNWVETTKLGTDLFFAAVSISDKTVIVGKSSDGSNGLNSGVAYIFEKNDEGVWSEMKISASDAAAQRYFGESVSISGSTAVVGSWGDSPKGRNSGSAYVFRKNGAGVWVEREKLIPSDGAADKQFGRVLSIFGNSVIVGEGNPFYIFE